VKNRMTYVAVGLAITFQAGLAWSQACNSSVDPSVAQPSSAGTSLASQDDAPRVLLSGNLAHGGYGAPQVKATAVAGQAGLLMGGRGAWVIGHSLTLGGGGYGLATRVDAPEQASGSATNTAISLGYGGFRAGYIIFPQDMVHFTVGLLIGGGGVSVVEKRAQSDIRTLHSASVFVLEPDAAIEVNITPSIRGAIDVSYRYMSDSGIPGLSSSAIGGPAAGAVLAFGWF
jgi:hypothetical protein